MTRQNKYLKMKMWVRQLKLDISRQQFVQAESNIGKVRSFKKN